MKDMRLKSRVTWCCIGPWIGEYVQIYLVVTSLSCSKDFEDEIQSKGWELIMLGDRHAK